MQFARLSIQFATGSAYLKWQNEKGICESDLGLPWLLFLLDPISSLNCAWSKRELQTVPPAQCSRRLTGRQRFFTASQRCTINSAAGTRCYANLRGLIKSVGQLVVCESAK